MEKKKRSPSWVNIYKDMSAAGLKRSFLARRQYSLAKDDYAATLNDDFMALAIAVRDRLIERWINTQQKYHRENVKRVYYLSMEFLIGRLLGNNIMNLQIWGEAAAAMEELGLNLEDLRDCEADAGLGNGGLGRLAACVLDSLATLGIPAGGYGIRYEYGLFNQKIVNGYQVESLDEWLSKGNPWEFPRQEYTVRVKFYGHTYMFRDAQGKLRVKWVDTEDVLAMPYDIPVAGYNNDVVNNLRLWSARSTEEFDLQYFNYGDYEGAVYKKVLSENITKVLYPNDTVNPGKELRLKQEYFLTAASIADIIRRFKAENHDLRDFPEKIAIQLNDTHPSLAIVEFMRVLVDEENIDWDTAWDVTVRTFAYTNHTVMPEALECWPIPLFEAILPRHMQLIYEINMRFLRRVSRLFPGDNDRLRRMSIIEEGIPKKVRMAHLSIVGAHSVNGVSLMHSELLRKDIFRDFNDVFPERFNNKTNGVTPRRWLRKTNTRLSSLISEAIGDKWVTDLGELQKLSRFVDDSSFCQKWQEVKKSNKKDFAGYIRKTTGIEINPESIFDVQVKRIHEYKRQALFGLFIISQYLKLKKDPAAPFIPRTFIVGGKAAPGYIMAKLIIKFINNIADAVNNDPLVKDKLKVVFVEDYRVSVAEKIFPATDLSEQISTAGTEASGTGCMKMMINGALTIGTYDGANMEMAGAVGSDNIFMFGRKAPELRALREKGYDPRRYIENNEILREVVRLIQHNFFSPVNYNLFAPIVGSIYDNDPFFICADFESYCAAQEKVSGVYADQALWTKKSLINVSCSGPFSIDRTVREYARDIWNLPVPFLSR